MENPCKSTPKDNSSPSVPRHTRTYTSQNLTAKQLAKSYKRLYQHNLIDEIWASGDLDRQQQFFAWFGEDVWNELCALDAETADTHKRAGRKGKPPLAQARLQREADRLGLPSAAAVHQLYKGRAAKDVHRAFKAWLEKNKLPPMPEPEYRGPKRKQAEIAAEKAAKLEQQKRDAERKRELARMDKDLKFKQLQRNLTRLASALEEVRDITTMEDVLLRNVRHVEDLVDTPEEDWLVGWPMPCREAFGHLRFALNHETVDTFLTTGPREQAHLRKEPLPNKRTSKFTRLTSTQVAEIAASNERTEYLAAKYRVPHEKIRKIRGTRQGNRKLTADQVRDILTYATVQDIPKKTRKRVQAHRYGVSYPAICKIHKGETWPDVYAEVKVQEKLKNERASH
jgi:uncharacterized protein (DUF433 family)